MKDLINKLKERSKELEDYIKSQVSIVNSIQTNINTLTDIKSHIDVELEELEARYFEIASKPTIDPAVVSILNQLTSVTGNVVSAPAINNNIVTESSVDFESTLSNDTSNSNSYEELLEATRVSTDADSSSDSDSLLSSISVDNVDLEKLDFDLDNGTESEKESHNTSELSNADIVANLAALGL